MLSERAAFFCEGVINPVSLSHDKKTSEDNPRRFLLLSSIQRLQSQQITVQNILKILLLSARPAGFAVACVCSDFGELFKG